MNPVFLGIFPPNISQVLLPLVVAGIIGFLLCYAHRFVGFIVVPAFVIWCLYIINDLEFFTSLLSGYMLVVYFTMTLCVVAMSIGTFLSWKRHRNNLQLN